MLSQAGERQSGVVVGGCLICSKKVEGNVSGNEAGGMRRLEKAMRKVFKYLLVPEGSWEVLGESVVWSVPFCGSCYASVEDIMKLEMKKDALELQIQSKVEELGRVVASTPPQLFLMGGCGGSGTGGGSQHKQVLEMWKYFRDPVMQNFVRGILPNPCVKMEMWSPGKDENGAASAQVNIESVNGAVERVEGNDDRDGNVLPHAHVMRPRPKSKKRPVQIKIKMFPPKKVNKGRVTKRKRGNVGKRKVLRKKQGQIRKIPIRKPRSRPVEGMNEDRMDITDRNGDDWDAGSFTSTDGSDLENLFEEIVVTRGMDGGIRSLSPVKSNCGSNTAKSKGSSQSPSNESNTVQHRKTRYSSNSSSSSSATFTPVVVTKSGIKKRIDPDDVVSVSEIELDKSYGSDSDSRSGLDKLDSRGERQITNLRATMHGSSPPEDMAIQVDKSSSERIVPVAVGDMGNHRSNPSESENNAGGNSILTSDHEADPSLANEIVRLSENAIQYTPKSPTENRSPCIPVARSEELDLFAHPPCNDERTHSQELMEMIFTPAHDNNELIPPSDDNQEDIVEPMNLLSTHFGMDLGSYIEVNGLNIPLE